MPAFSTFLRRITLKQSQFAQTRRCTSSHFDRHSTPVPLPSLLSCPNDPTTMLSAKSGRMTNRYFHHVEIQTPCSFVLAQFLSLNLGMEIVGVLRTSKGSTHALRSGQAMILCTSPTPEQAAYLTPQADDTEFHSDIKVTALPTTVRAIAFHTDSLQHVQHEFEKQADSSSQIQLLNRNKNVLDIDWHDMMGNTYLRFVEQDTHNSSSAHPSGTPEHLHGFKSVKQNKCLMNRGGVVGIDHIAVAVPNVNIVHEQMNRLLAWDLFRVFSEDILERPLSAVTLSSASREGLLTLTQPTAAHSVVGDFLRCNQGIGVHHIALRCGDLLQFAQHMSDCNLWNPMPSPSTAYYESIETQALHFLTQQEFATLQRLGMLFDGNDEECGLIQVFLPYLNRNIPSVFFELAGRVRKRVTHDSVDQVHTVTAGCGGFGDNNVTHLYDCMVKCIHQ